MLVQQYVDCAEAVGTARLLCYVKFGGDCCNQKPPTLDRPSCQSLLAAKRDDEQWEVVGILLEAECAYRALPRGFTLVVARR